MHRRWVWRQAHSLLVVLLACAALAQATARPSPANFPAQDVRVFREWVSSSTLRLRFEAPTIAPRQISAARSATFLIAGSPFRSPQFQVRSCHFYRVRADRVVGESYELPYANEARTQPLQILRFTDLGQFRHYHVYALHLNVATVAPARVAGISELWVLDYAEVDVDLGPPVTMNLSDLERAREFARTTPQFVAEEAMLLNPDLDASYFQTTTSQNWSGNSGLGQSPRYLCKAEARLPAWVLSTRSFSSHS
ncbi:MAG: hypothetical protein KatS3mg130_1757 [Candidatus Sumerlaea sp.]|nr:MAG: hypothetical protein KatS3mg130_1757 [Candidatus Sumerlaea sp.]